MKTRTRSKPRTPKAKNNTLTVVGIVLSALVGVSGIVYATMTKKQADEAVALARENQKLARQQNILLDSLVDAMQKELLRKDSVIKALRAGKK